MGIMEHLDKFNDKTIAHFAFSYLFVILTISLNIVFQIKTISKILGPLTLYG